MRLPRRRARCWRENKIRSLAGAPPQISLFQGKVNAGDMSEMSKTGNSESDQCRLTSRQLIEQNLEEMIAEMNAKRTRDHTLLQNLKRGLEEWASSAHTAVETAVYEKTVRSSEIIDNKLAELVESIGRITKLEAELEKFKEQLGAFYVHVQ